MSAYILPTTKKTGKVATIGSRMVEEQGCHLVDIRYDRHSYWTRWSERALRQEFGHRYHPMPELFQRYGLLKPLPHAPVEQPVMLRTARSQRVMLPDYGPCMMRLSVTLWLADPPQQCELGNTVSQLQENEEVSVDAVSFTRQEEQQV